MIPLQHIELEWSGYSLSYNNIFNKNIKAEICEILRIF